MSAFTNRVIAASETFAPFFGYAAQENTEKRVAISKILILNLFTICLLYSALISKTFSLRHRQATRLSFVAVSHPMLHLVAKVAVQGRKGLTRSKRLYQTKQHALYKPMPFSNIALASLEIACHATP
jgi:hypothetical protein